MTARLATIYRDARVLKAVLMALLLAVFAACAWLVGGTESVAALGIALGIVYLITPRIDPRYLMRLYKARPIASTSPLYGIARSVAARAGLMRVPELYLVPSGAPNAFAIGDREHAAIALSAGSLRLLDRREIIGVLAHETAHIAHGDSNLSILIEMIRRMTGVAALVGLFLLFAAWMQMPGLEVSVWMPLIFLCGPAAAFLLQRALSRVTEHLADARAVALTGDPRGLASALAKINRATRTLWERFIGRSAPEVLPSILQTHPQIEDRVRRLLAIEGRPVVTPQTPQFSPNLRGHVRPRFISNPLNLMKGRI